MLTTKTRKRIGGPKRRSGCKTCKQRRVKCDEARPECKRCVQGNRVCDGYDNFYELQAVAKMDKHIMLLKKSISEQPDMSFNERSAFEFFRLNMLNDVPGNFFDMILWQDHLLRRSMSQPALKHALIALGSMDAQRKIQKHISVPHLSLTSYNKAIRGVSELISQQSDVDLQLILIASLLFATFELHQGAYQKAEAHLLGGYRIFGSSDKLSSCAASSVGSQKVMYQIRRTYERLLQQFSLHTTAFDDVKLAKSNEIQPSLSSHEHFDDLPSARKALNLHGAAMRRLIDNINHKFSSETDPALQELNYYNIWQDQQNQLASLAEWHAELLSLPEHTTQNFEQKQTARLLRMHYHVLRLKLSMAFSNGNEMLWDAYLPDFSLICDHAQSFVLEEQSQPYPFSKYLLDIAILAPLNLVIRKCRHPKIRRFALKILLQANHQEGVLSASLLAQTGSRLMQLEENGIAHLQEANDIPEDQRVEQMRFDNPSGKFICRQRCLQTADGWTFFTVEDDTQQGQTHEVL